MKKYTTILIAILFFSTSYLRAQGLEQIIVEKYYVSDENDTSVDEDGGVLPINSVTYRVYVDMLPDYIFQAVYGESGHELLIETTTKFFNNEDRGEVFSNGIGQNRLDDNTVMLDSWLSVGAACEDCVGVLKEDDDGVNTIENGDDVLINNDTCAGIPLTMQDGHVEGTPEPVTAVGLSEVLEIFNSNDIPAPNVLSTENGAWSSLNGSVGADSMDNKVLIGQFTTDGDFSFELNIQIRNELTLQTENYVARNPVDNEIIDATLIYSSVVDSVVSINYLDGQSDIMNIYPSPATNYLSLEIASGINVKGSYEIISTSGERLAFNHFNEATISDIDISHFANGLYFIKLNLNGNTYIRKFIKTSK